MSSYAASLFRLVPFLSLRRKKCILPGWNNWVRWNSKLWSLSSPKKNSKEIYKLSVAFVTAAPLGYHKDGRRERLFQAASLRGSFTTSSTGSESESYMTLTLSGAIYGWICAIIDILCVLMRVLCIGILVAPLVLLGPFAIRYPEFRNKRWYPLLIRILEVCGPVYVKLGQWASTRRDIFPTDLCDQLTKLQRCVRTHSWNHTRRVLEENFGPLEELFSEFDQSPVGSGCCAQVYKARLVKSRLENERNIPGSHHLTVAVKVLHPNIRKLFDRDLGVMRSILDLISFAFPSLEWLSLKESLDEFAFSMKGQLDLMGETENILQLRKDFHGDRTVVFPRPIIELCRTDVMVQTYEEGYPISSILSQLNKVPVETRKRLADIGVDMLLKMIFKNNFVHGDLHPGNILVRGFHPSSEIGGSSKARLQLVVLDSGITATLAETDLANFRTTFAAIVKGDGRQVGKLFLEQSVNMCDDHEAFICQMNDIVMTARAQHISLARVDVASLLLKVFSTLRNHKVKLDASFSSVVLSIMILEGLGRALDPDMDLLIKSAPHMLKSQLRLTPKHERA